MPQALVSPPRRRSWDHRDRHRADRAEGVLEVGRDGAGRFKSVVLHPTVTVAAGSDVSRARALHQPAHEKCFIANSVNFPVECEPEIVSGG
jgi:organic hydroperoxide reductase OsmC/OhrA